jgi:hypothetical protein
MKVSRGKIHKYLGMTLYYSVPGQVKITILDYVDEILAVFDKAEQNVEARRQVRILTPVQGRRGLRETRTSQGRGIPQPGGEDFVCHQASKVGHLYCNSIPDNESS